MSKIWLLPVVCLVLGGSCSAPGSAGPGAMELLPAPEGMRGVSAVDGPDLFVGANLYEYVNGGADAYHDYGFREVATRTVETLAGADLNNYDFTNCRDCGWPLRHLIGSYQATGRKQFLNGAAIIVERVLERQRSSGGWVRLMVPGHCFHVPPRHMGNAGFMVGIVLAALKRYHEETGDTAVEQAIVDAAHYLIKSMWDPQRNAFRYTSCPGSTVSGLNTQILEGIGYAWYLSGDEVLKQTLLDGLPGCLTPPSTRPGSAVGKDISTRLRSMPFIMEAVVRSGGGHDF